MAPTKTAEVACFCGPPRLQIVCFGGWWKFWNNAGNNADTDTSRSYRKRDYSVREHEHHHNKHDAVCDGADQRKEPNTVVVNVAPGILPGGPAP